MKKRPSATVIRKAIRVAVTRSFEMLGDPVEWALRESRRMLGHCIGCVIADLHHELPGSHINERDIAAEVIRQVADAARRLA